MAAESAGERVARSLRDRVLTGFLAPGTLLSQASIAAEFGVSRIPVRDALHTLATEGLMDLGPSTATVPGLSIAELQELYELREAVEPLTTRIAMPNVGRAEIVQLSALCDVMELETTSTAEWMETNAAFHAVLYMRAPRPRMVALTEQLRRLTDRYLHLHLDTIGSIGHLQTEHRAILAAARGGDPAQVAELTRIHLATSHDFILRYLLGEPSYRDGQRRSDTR
ncbi:MAG TPA: GntR family transcriptional regulator [Mycobacteriales bacterium]|jgi:DNA-binding GntR family transcriptional regulator|nr:GntR family transcriptional regulator [Mycobacteriales bacterium]